MQKLCFLYDQKAVPRKKKEDKRKWNLSPLENGPHSSDEGNRYIKTNLHTGCLKKVLKKRRTQIAGLLSTHLYGVLHGLNWKLTT